jgi:hypothetical protein
MTSKFSEMYGLKGRGQKIDSPEVENPDGDSESR